MKNLILLIIMLVNFNAHAALITVEFDQTEVSVGSTVSVSLLASDFGEFDLFDLDVNFDSNIFAYADASLQSDLPLDDGLFTLGLIATPLSNHLALSYFDFASFSGGNFLLAKFDVVALATGISEFSLSNASFFDINGQLSVDTSASNQLTVSGTTSIPEPTSWALLLLPALLLLTKRRVH